MAKHELTNEIQIINKKAISIFVKPITILLLATHKRHNILRILIYTLNTVASISKIPMNGIIENKIINIFAVTNQFLVKVTCFVLRNAQNTQI